MTPNTIDAWMKKASIEPYAAGITLKEFNSGFYDGCSDRREGTVSQNFINDCIACFQHLASLDGHLHLDDLATALIAWFVLLYKGMLKDS